jgi:glycine/D-amino acid oxidase-like deaminating enzyme
MKTGTPTVSLSKVVEELDTRMSDEWRAFLNRATGETLQLEQAVLSAAEDGEDGEEDSLEDWQREELTQAVEILDSKDWLELPDAFDINEWKIMRDYCGTVDDDAVHQELLRAIHGRGAFRCFKDIVHRLELVDSWYAFRNSAIRAIVADWLTGQGVEFAE